MKKLFFLCVFFMLSLTIHAQINITATTTAKYVRFALSVDNVLQDGQNGTINTVTDWQTEKVLTFADLDAIRLYAESFGISFEVAHRICFRIQAKQANCYGANCISNWSPNARCFDLSADPGLSCEDCPEVALANVYMRNDSTFFDVCEIDAETGLCNTIVATYGTSTPMNVETFVNDNNNGTWTYQNETFIDQNLGYNFLDTESINITFTPNLATPGTYDVSAEVDFCAAGLKQNGVVFGRVDGCMEQDSITTFTPEGVVHLAGDETQWLNRDIFVSRVNSSFSNWRSTRLTGVDIEMEQGRAQGSGDNCNAISTYRYYGTPDAKLDVLVGTGSQCLGARNTYRHFGGLKALVGQHQVRAYGDDTACDSVYHEWYGGLNCMDSPYSLNRRVVGFNAENGNVTFDHYPGDLRREVNNTGSYLFTDETGTVRVGDVSGLSSGLAIIGDCGPGGEVLIGLNNGSDLFQMPKDSIYLDGFDFILNTGECDADTVALPEGRIFDVNPPPPGLTVSTIGVYAPDGNLTGTTYNITETVTTGGTLPDGTNFYINEVGDTTFFEQCCVDPTNINTVYEYCPGGDGNPPFNGFEILANGGDGYAIVRQSPSPGVITSVPPDGIVDDFQYNTPLIPGTYQLVVIDIDGNQENKPFLVRYDCPPSFTGDVTGVYSIDPATGLYTFDANINFPPSITVTDNMDGTADVGGVCVQTCCPDTICNITLNDTVLDPTNPEVIQNAIAQYPECGAGSSFSYVNIAPGEILSPVTINDLYQLIPSPRFTPTNVPPIQSDTISWLGHPFTAPGQFVYLNSPFLPEKTCQVLEVINGAQFVINCDATNYNQVDDVPDLDNLIADTYNPSVDFSGILQYKLNNSCTQYQTIGNEPFEFTDNGDGTVTGDGYCIPTCEYVDSVFSSTCTLETGVAFCDESILQINGYSDANFIGAELIPTTTLLFCADADFQTAVQNAIADPATPQPIPNCTGFTVKYTGFNGDNIVIASTTDVEWSAGIKLLYDCNGETIEAIETFNCGADLNNCNCGIDGFAQVVGDDAIISFREVSNTGAVATINSFTIADHPNNTYGSCSGAGFVGMFNNAYATPNSPQTVGTCPGITVTYTIGGGLGNYGIFTIETTGAGNGDINFGLEINYDCPGACGQEQIIYVERKNGGCPNGTVYTSPNGSRWCLTVGDLGNVTTTQL